MDIPHDIDTEQLLISILIREPARVHCVDLDVSDFFASIFQKIYGVMRSAYERGESWSIDSIRSDLLNDEEFLKYGGISLLLNLFYNAIPAVHDDIVRGYCATIKKMSTLRKIISLSSEMSSMAYSRNEPDKIFEIANSKMQLIASAYRCNIRDVRFTKLRIVTSNPRAYYLFIEPPGQEIPLTIQQIRSPKTVQMMIQNHFDFIPRMPKNWLDILNDLMLHAEKVPPPQDAIFEYRIRKAVLEYFSQAGEGECVEDLRGYMYICKDDYRCFYIRQLIKWLETVEKIKVTPFQLWNIMEKWGCIKDKRIRLNKTTTVWALPESFFEDEATVEDADATSETTEKTTGDTAVKTTNKTTEDTVIKTTEKTTEDAVSKTTEKTTVDAVIKTTNKTTEDTVMTDIEYDIQAIDTDTVQEDDFDWLFEED